MSLIELYSPINSFAYLKHALVELYLSSKNSYFYFQFTVIKVNM